MILSILGFLIVFLASLFWGRRLYGSWSAAIVLAIFSPLPFLFLVPIVVGVILWVLIRFGVPIASLDIDSDSEWVQGAATLFTGIVCAFALRHFAKTEGVKDEKPRT